MITDYSEAATTVVCGSSFCLSSAAAAAVAMTEADVAVATTAAYGLSFCSSSAAAVAVAETDADANLKDSKRGIYAPFFTYI